MPEPITVVRLLGSFVIECPPRAHRHEVSSRKARALLSFLALHLETGARREHLAGLFWGDRSESEARHNLRQTLLRLKKDLCPEAAAIIIADYDRIRLDPARVHVDAQEFVALPANGHAGTLARAAALYRGPLLADLHLDVEEFDTWATAERSRFAGVAARIFGACMRGADARGDGDEAIQAAEHLVRVDPLREDAQRFLTQLLAKYRGQGAALAYAKKTTELFERELGIKVLLVGERQPAAYLPPPADAPGALGERRADEAPRAIAERTDVPTQAPPLAAAFAGRRTDASGAGLPPLATIIVAGLVAAAFTAAVFTVLPWLSRGVPSVAPEHLQRGERYEGKVLIQAARTFDRPAPSGSETLAPLRILQ